MSWRWDWYDWEGRRPLLATIICAVFFVASGKTLLRTIHLLPPLPFGPEPVDHMLLRTILKVAESVLYLSGAIFLWQMRPIAWKFFAAETSLAMLGAIYLTYIDPSEHMLALRATHHATVTILLAMAFDIAITIYVWRITTKQPAIVSSPYLDHSA